MKTLILVIASVAALSGCAVVPAYGPGYYAPAPAVVVPYYGGYYGYRGGYGYRGYR